MKEMDCFGKEHWIVVNPTLPEGKQEIIAFTDKPSFEVAKLEFKQLLGWVYDIADDAWMSNDGPVKMKLAPNEVVKENEY